MASSDGKPNINPSRLAIAVLVGIVAIWLVLKVLRALVGFVKFGIVIAIIGAIVYFIAKAVSSSKDR